MSITIYCKDNCPFCDKAKIVLEEINAPYKEVHMDPSIPSYEQDRDILIAKTKVNHKTFPFIFVGDHFIGGYTELVRSVQTLKFHELAAKIGIKIEVDF